METAGAVDITYQFNPPISIESEETPALKLGRKIIRTIKEETES